MTTEEEVEKLRQDVETMKEQIRRLQAGMAILEGKMQEFMNQSPGQSRP